MQLRDEDLSLMAAKGDQNAFGQILERHYDLIFRIGIKLSGSRGFAEDFAQDICVMLVDKIAQFRGDAKFTSWLYKICLNKYRDDWRKMKTRDRAYEGVKHVSEIAHDPLTEAHSRKEWLVEVMNDLSLDLRMTAVLVIAEGFDQSEAATILDIPAGTVAWRMSEIKKILRARALKEGLADE